MTLRLATDHGARPADTLADTLGAMLSKAHSQNLALRLFLGCIEGWLQSRGVISDVALVDMIAVAAGNAAAALERAQ